MSKVSKMNRLFSVLIFTVLSTAASATGNDFERILGSIKTRLLGPEKLEKIDKIFVVDIFRAERGYIESITGPPFSRYSDNFIYKVDGCNVVINYANNQVRAVGLETITDRCTFDFGRFTGGSFRAVNSLSFSDLDSLSYKKHAFQSSCNYFDCGNATDPTIIGFFDLPRVYQFIEVTAESVATQQYGLYPLLEWRRAIGRAAPAAKSDYKIQARYLCGVAGRNLARPAVLQAKISSIILGYDLDKNSPDCIQDDLLGNSQRN
jgi:hypothetical protein